MTKIQKLGRRGGWRWVGLLPLAALPLMLSSFTFLSASEEIGVEEAEGNNRKKGKTRLEKLPSRTPTTTNEKLSWLLSLGMTSAEIALATGSSVRGIEERRKRLKGSSTDNNGGSGRNVRIDVKIDDLFSIAFLLAQRYVIPSENIRGWFIGRTAYLGEQRPANLLREGQFELVRDAAIAYASGQSPEEFLSEQAPVPRVGDPVTV